MDFNLTFTKGETTDDAAPSSSTPQARIITLPAYWDGGRKFPTGSVSAYFEVCNSSGAVAADGTVSAQLHLRPIGTKKFLAVGAKQTGIAAATSGQLVEFETSGLNSPCEAFIAITDITGTDKTTVKAYATATGIRSPTGVQVAGVPSLGPHAGAGSVSVVEATDSAMAAAIAKLVPYTIPEAVNITAADHVPAVAPRAISVNLAGTVKLTIGGVDIVLYLVEGVVYPYSGITKVWNVGTDAAFAASALTMTLWR